MKCTTNFTLVVMFSTLSVVASVSDLVAVVQVARHGQRTPAFEGPITSRYNWPEVPGGLTDNGKLQMFDLGLFTRQRYPNMSLYYHSNQYLAFTTDYDRTHMSAQCVNAGRFIPTGSDIWNRYLLWQPIPVRVASKHIFRMIPDCGIFVKEFNRGVDELITKNMPDLIQYIINNTAKSDYTGFDFVELHDTLVIQDEFGYQLPSWTKPIYPEVLEGLAILTYKAGTITDLQKKLTLGAWFNKILKHFTKAFKYPDLSLKSLFFSGHEFNIGSMLNILGVENYKFPKFASSLYFELRNKSGIPIVNLWYKVGDVIEPIEIKNCGFDCKLWHLVRILRPWLVTKKTWEELCCSEK